MSRHVFVFIDGTLARSETNTNIWKLYQAVGGVDNRDARYQEGIASMSAAKYLQTILPTEINAEAYQQYKLLDALDVRSDDRLYIFGYSRGAIVARILAQMITSDVARASIVGQADQVANVERNTVDFLGLFDPVRGYPYPFSIAGYDADVYKNTSILNLSEIVSLDDGFPFFRSDASIANTQPERERMSIINRLVTARENSTDKSDVNRTSTRKSSRHFCLFPGVHRDVGGQEANVALGHVSFFQMLQDFLLVFPDAKSEFNQDHLERLRKNLDQHDQIQVGEGTSTLRKLIRIKRKFRSDPNATLHPLAKELQGARGVAQHLLWGKRREYKISGKYSDWPLSKS